MLLWHLGVLASCLLALQENFLCHNPFASLNLFNQAYFIKQDFFRQFRFTDFFKKFIRTLRIARVHQRDMWFMIPGEHQ